MNVEEFLELNIPELEKKTRINRGTWSKYFSTHNHENPSWTSILKISSALGMTADQLIKGIEIKRRQKKNILKA